MIGLNSRKLSNNALYLLKNRLIARSFRSSPLIHKSKAKDGFLSMFGGLATKDEEETQLANPLPDILQYAYSPNSMRITGYGDDVFEVNDEILVHSSILLHPTMIWKWNARKPEDITMDSLIPFQLMYPRLELLLVGCGPICDPMFSPTIFNEMKAMGTFVEFVSTPIAASTFNVLCAEGRNCAAAILTLKPHEVDSALRMV